MDIDVILAKIEQDSVIEKTALDHESMKTVKLHGEWLKIYSVEKRALNKLRSKLKTIALQKEKFYTGKGTAEEYKKKEFHLKLLKSDVEKYIEADEDFIEVKEEYEDQSDKVFVIQEFIKQLGKRQYSIRDALDFIKWTHGDS